MNDTKLTSRFRIRHLAIAAGMSGIAFVWANALLWQNGPHPAPLFGRSEIAQPTQTQPVSVHDLEFLAAKEFDIPLSDLSTQARAQLVGELQAALKNLGYYSGAVDGIEGPMTRNAVSAYEAAFGLPSTGTITYSIYRKVRQAAHQASNGRAPARLASDQQKVLSVQRVLSDLGYGPGPVNGEFTGSTEDAIRRFETHRGLPPTGQISEIVVRELSSVSGVQIDPRS